MRTKLKGLLIGMMVFVMMFAGTLVVQAASGSVTFGSSSYTKKEGEEFNVGVYVKSEDADIAFLQLSEPLPKSFFIFDLGFHWTEGGSFQTYGFRKANYYDGLSASGILCAETQKVNMRTKLIQLDCRDIDKGMSGAPVLDTTYNTVVGMICEYWDTQSLTDSSLAFAVPTSELINVNASIKSAVPELNAVPKYTESGKLKKTLSPTELLDVEDQYIFACSRLAVIVAADQFDDGSWGRSLWKETGILGICL